MRHLLEQYGIEPLDIPKGLLLFKGMAWTTWALTLPICYKYQPLRRLIARPQTRAFLDRIHPNMYSRGSTWVTTKLNRLSASLYFQRFTNHFGLCPTATAYALCENMVLFKMLLPVTIPLHMYLTILVMSPSADGAK